MVLNEWIKARAPCSIPCVPSLELGQGHVATVDVVKDGGDLHRADLAGEKLLHHSSLSASVFELFFNQDALINSSKTIAISICSALLEGTLG